MDVENLLKPLVDSLCSVIGVDDRQIIRLEISKQVNVENRFMIIVRVMDYQQFPEVKNNES